MNVKDKTALITGAASGLGLNFARELLRCNAKCVAIVDLPQSKGEEVVANFDKEFRKNRAFFFPCNVADADQLTTCFKKVVETFNGLDILINNAGILNDAHYELMISINYVAVIHSSILGLEFMGKHKGGRGGTIVNIGSTAGLMPVPNTPIYSSTKHAVIGFSRSLKAHYEKTGVRILVLCPGFTDTSILNNMKLMDIVDEKIYTKFKTAYKQSPWHVAKALVEMVEKGENGEVYVCEDDGPLYAVKFPNYQDYRPSIQ